MAAAAEWLERLWKELMTIKELIDELSKYNEQLEVLLQTAKSEDVGVEPRVVLSHRKSGRSCVLLEY